MYAYMHQDIQRNTCMHTYIHTYIHTHIYTHIHKYIHACMHAEIHTYIHSFIHSAISKAPLQVLYYSEALQTTARIAHCIGVSRRSAQATVGKGLAQGHYMAARAGVEPTTLRLKAIDSTKAPPCPIIYILYTVLLSLLRFSAFLQQVQIPIDPNLSYFYCLGFPLPSYRNFY